MNFRKQRGTKSLAENSDKLSDNDNLEENKKPITSGNLAVSEGEFGVTNSSSSPKKRSFYALSSKSGSKKEDELKTDGFTPQKASSLPSVDYKFILNSDSKIIGKLELKQRALISGGVKGDVESDSMVSISESANITGNVTANSIFVAGSVKGDLIASEKIVLVAPAKVYGKIGAPSIKIEEGVVFEGECRMENLLEVN